MNPKLLMAYANYWSWSRKIVKQLPEDVWQIANLAVLYENPKKEFFKELRKLEREVLWQPMAVLRTLAKLRNQEEPKYKGSERPSKKRRKTGYRKDRERHRVARMKVSPERRREIARLGGLAAAKKRRERCSDT